MAPFGTFRKGAHSSRNRARREARASMRGERLDPRDEIETLEISAESGDNVALDYTLRPPQFQRIRRITGYLVGTLDRFNDAKRHEEHDRVKHGLSK